MDEMIKLVSQKTGLSEDKARVAVQTVVGWLKERLPGGLGSQIDTLMSGGKPDGSSLGGLFGGKK